MKLIVGLGNPGAEYAATRHNLGYRVAEELAARLQLGAWKEKFHGWLVEGLIRDERVGILRPTTFMNVSGKSVIAAAAFYKLSPADLLVVSDDLDLPPGRVRLRAGGSSGGQRGLENIIDRLGTREFARVRMGIGRPARGSATDYVLGRFDASDETWLPDAVGRACDAAECWLARGIVAAMNEFNRSE